MNARIIWHGSSCPHEHLAQVDAELAALLDGPLDSPQQLISHLVFLPNGGEVTAWGQTGDDAFHAEYHAVPTKERADQVLADRIREAVSRTGTDQKEDMSEAIDRQSLEAKHGKVWSADELAQEFVVTAIIAPHIVARRRADNQVGTLEFTNQPRFYFNFQPNKGAD